MADRRQQVANPQKAIRLVVGWLFSLSAPIGSDGRMREEEEQQHLTAALVWNVIRIAVAISFLVWAMWFSFIG